MQQLVATTVATTVRRAGPSDAEALAELVNRAYQAEAFFVDGDRTHAAEVAALARDHAFLVLEYSGGLAAAVCVEARGYFGMLSVAPELQGLGLGTRMVRIAEALCESAGCATVSLRIVNVREELGRWYRSLGYREVGTTPYTHRLVKQPCHLVDMRKDLVAVRAAECATIAA